MSLHNCLSCSGPVHINFHTVSPVCSFISQLSVPGSRIPHPRTIPTASHIRKHSNTQRQLISHALAPWVVESLQSPFPGKDKMHNNFLALQPFYTFPLCPKSTQTDWDGTQPNSIKRKSQWGSWIHIHTYAKANSPWRTCLKWHNLRRSAVPQLRPPNRARNFLNNISLVHMKITQALPKHSCKHTESEKIRILF